MVPGTRNSSMKITIAGYGFVGKAHLALLKDNHDIEIVDPAVNNNSISQDTDGVIICVSTPQGEDGSCCMDNVVDVIKASPDVPILIKSTISIEGWKMLQERFPNRMLNFSPEFLRAATAVEDLKSMDLMLIGGTSCNFWCKVFNVSCEVADPEQLILAKYARNSFLALKVAFFNQIYDLCEALNIEYEAVAHYTGIDSRITESHTQITKERGFGGHCFPKDTLALIKTAEKNNVDFSLIKEARTYNNKIRRE